MGSSATHTASSKKAMIKALEKSLGIVATAAKAVGIERRTHYRWMNDDDEYRESVELIGDLSLDATESKLFENIEANDTASIIFHLKCRGKKRGYVERQEITGANGDALAVNHQLGTLGQMTPEQIKSIINDD